MTEEFPLFLGLNDRSISDIPKSVEKRRHMVSTAPMAANPGKWIAQPRMPVPTGEHVGGRMQWQDSLRRWLREASRRQQLSPSIRPKTGTWELKTPYRRDLQSRRRLLARRQDLHLWRLHRAKPLPALEVFRLRRRDRHNGRRSQDCRGHAVPSRRSHSTAKSICSAGATCARSNGTRFTIPRPTNTRSLPACAARPGRSLLSASATIWV